MSNIHPTHRVFMFLQGPHGPFFSLLAKMLVTAGAQVWPVGFNAGDQVFWQQADQYIVYRSPFYLWSEAFSDLVDEKDISDIVLYGYTRPVHATTIRKEHQLGLGVHVFEKGCLRPYWVTYERDGSKGHSKLMQRPLTKCATPCRPARFRTHRGHLIGATCANTCSMVRSIIFSCSFLTAPIQTFRDIVIWL